jgi:choline dehydrogenase-like flavoprotein
LLTSSLSLGCALGVLFVATDVLGLVTFKERWFLYLDAALLSLVYMQFAVAFRKSSSLLPMIIFSALYVPCDFFVQAQYRDLGRTAMWSYPAQGLLGGLPPLVQFFAIAVGDVLFGITLALWLSRVIANIVKPLSAEAKSKIPSEAQTKALFDRWSEKVGTFEKRDPGFYVLRSVGLTYTIYLGIVLLGALGSSPYPEPLRNVVRMTYENPAISLNTYAKLVLMAMLCMIGAYNKEMRFHAGVALVVGHVMSIVASLYFYFADAASTLYRDFLMTSAVVDAVLAAAFGYVMWKHREEKSRYEIQKDFPEFYSIGNRLTVMSFYALGGLSIAACIGIVALRLFADPVSGWGAVYGFPDPQISNALTKFATIACLGFMLARREKLRRKLYSVLIASFTVSIVLGIAWMIAGQAIGDGMIATRTAERVDVQWYFILSTIVDVVVLSSLIGLRRMYYNMEYSVSSLTPASAQNVMAMHKALFDGDEEMHGAIMQTVDQHSANVRGRKRGLLNFPFLLQEFVPGVLALKPGLFTMSRDERMRILKKQVMRKPQVRARSFSPEFADVLFKLGTATHALVTLAHYTHIRSREKTGYVMPDARDRLQGDIVSAAPPFNDLAPLPTAPHTAENYKPTTPATAKLPAPRIVTATKEPQIPDEVDYCIIGSGAGGAVMAYRLAQKEPNAKIVVIERGPRYSPLQDFNDNEMEMVRKLYKEGGLQQTKRFDLMILQGECLGGTTVINNAVCFPMPDVIKQLWDTDYGIDLSDLEAEYKKIADEIDIHEIDPISINTRVDKVFRKGVSGLPSSAGLATESLLANHSNMMGEGLCNLGNKRMRKRSMLETYIPWAEGRGVEFISETSAVRFYNEGSRVTGVLLRSDIGTMTRVKIRKALVVAGGVIASSHFLMRSGVTKNVGERMSCNFAFPLSFEFDEELKAYDGTQITLGALDPQSRAVWETYMNPPGSFALSLPFYFEEHTRAMNRYSHMVNFGALVGSEANGRIEPNGDVLNGRAFTWELGARDKEHIKLALSTAVMLGKHAGARYAMVPTEPGLRLDLRSSDPGDFVKALEDYPISMSDLRLTSAHPQGGNGMAATGSPKTSERVVNENFQVDGFENLFVADASVFPTGITVNPQWTIMALSSMAAQKVSQSQASKTAVAWPPRSTSSLPWLFSQQKKEVAS